jgi:3-oxoacyl-[acyl-carrier-protein] synthase-3
MMGITASIGISGSGCYLPKKIVSVSELAARLGIKSELLAGEALAEHIHISDKSEDEFFMAGLAVKNALKDAKLDPKDIDIVIFCGGIPHKKVARPSSSEIIRSIKADKAYGFDMEGGFIVGLMGMQAAKDTLLGNPYMSHALVVASQSFADTFMFRDESSRFSNTVFGDGAAAVVLSKNHTQNNILSSSFVTDHYTGYVSNLIKNGAPKTGGSAPNGLEKFLGLDQMMVKKMLSALVEKCADNFYKSIDMCLKSINLDIKDVNHLVPSELTVKEAEQLALKIDNKGFRVHNNLAGKGHLGHAETLANLHIVLKSPELRNLDIIVVAGSSYDCSAGAVAVRK